MEENCNMQNNTNVDTVNLIDLFDILAKRKKLIISITVIVTIFSYIYVNFIAKPIYQGNIFLEAGEVVNIDLEKGTVQVIKLNSPSFANSIMEAKYSNRDKLEFDMSIVPMNNSKLFKYSVTSNNKELIKKRLKEAIKFTLDRDKKMAKLYSGTNAKITNAKVVIPITILDEPIKPNKKLIVIASFVSALIFSIFIAFFIEFLTEAKKKRI